MKKIGKMILAGIFAATLVMGFVSCSNGNSDDSTPTYKQDQNYEVFKEIMIKYELNEADIEHLYPVFDKYLKETNSAKKNEYYYEMGNYLINVKNWPMDKVYQCYNELMSKISK